jgi:hypothetical protein
MRLTPIVTPRIRTKITAHRSTSWAVLDQLHADELDQLAAKILAALDRLNGTQGGTLPPAPQKLTTRQAHAHADKLTDSGGPT